MDNIDFDFLFAQRIEYMDFTTDEYVIINRLKNKLIQLGVNSNDINTILFDFYNFFEIPITFGEIEQVPLVSPYSVITIPVALFYQNNDHHDDDDQNDNHQDDDDQNDDNQNDNQDDYDDQLLPPLVQNTEPLPPHQNMLNLLSSLINNILPEQNNTGIIFEYNLEPININRRMEDVVVTTDENSLNNIPVLKITNSMNENCTICMNEMNLDEEYLDIECKHIFHKECLNTYLKNYNHICPVCRHDIGISSPRI